MMGEPDQALGGPLPDDIASLLDAERSFPGTTATLRSRLEQRVTNAIAQTAAAADVDGGDVTGTASGAGKATASGAVTGGSGATIASGVGAGKLALVALAGVIAGAVGGVGLYRAAIEPSAVASGRTDGTASEVASDVPEAQGSVVEEAAPNAHGGTDQPAAVSERPREDRDLADQRPGDMEIRQPGATAGGLAATSPTGGAQSQDNDPLREVDHERLLIDTARTALMRGDYEEAIAATHRHTRRFPQGSMIEEREAIAIVALSRSGRGAQANLRAERFIARYPRSVHRAMVDAELNDR